MALQIRRGTDAERQSVTPKEGELVYTTDTNRLWVGGKIAPSQSLTPGGILVSGSLVNDTNPTLAADMDLNGNNITGTGNININGNITATGNINLGDGVEDNVIVGGQITGDLIPGSKNTFDLGAPASGWKTLYVSDIVAETQVSAGDLSIKGSITKDDSSVIYDGATQALTVGDIASGAITASGAISGTSVAVTSVTANTLTGDLTGSVFADDSTLLVDGINGTLSNGTLTLENNNIYGSTLAEEFYGGFIGNGMKLVAIGDRSDPACIVIEGNDAPLVIRGVATNTGSTTMVLEASRFSGTTQQAVQPGDYIGALGFDAYEGAANRRAALISTTVQSAISGTNFDTDMTISVLAQTGLYNQYVFKSFGLFETAGVSLFSASEAELSGISTVAQKGSIGFGDTRDSMVVYDGTVFRTVTTNVGVPAGPTATGKAGQIAGDADYVYFCHSNDNWIRVAKDASWT
jgi:hypothetical protein